MSYRAHLDFPSSIITDAMDVVGFAAAQEKFSSVPGGKHGSKQVVEVWVEKSAGNAKLHAERMIK